MTGRRRLRVCVHGVVQGVGFRPFVYTTAAALGLSGSVRNDSSGAIIEVEGDAADIDDFLARAAGPPPPLAVIESIETQDIPAGRWHRFRDRRHVAVRRRPHAGLPRRRHVRRLRGRTARPGRPALPACVRQLHQLRPAVHHHRLAALRPRRHHDGALPDVRRLRARIPRPGRPAIPRPAGLLPELRADAALPRRPTVAVADGEMALHAGPAAAARRRHPRRQGHRRLPPGLRRGQRARRSPSCDAESAAATSRSPSWCPICRRRMRDRRRRRHRRSAARRPAATDRAAAAPARCARSPTRWRRITPTSA